MFACLFPPCTALLGIEYIGPSGDCFCFGTACEVLATNAAPSNGATKYIDQGNVVTAVGACSMYPLMSAYTCQTVTYPSSGCIASDNSQCNCLGSSQCTAATGVATAWYAYFLFDFKHFLLVAFLLVLLLT